MNTAITTLETLQAPRKEELETLQRDLSAHWAVPEIVEVDGLTAIELTLSGDRPIDLSAAPANKVVHLRIQAPPQTTTVALTGLGPDSVVAITVLDLPSNQDIKTLALHDCRGQVRVVSMVEGVELVCTEPPAMEDVAEVATEEARSVVLHQGASLTVNEPLTHTMLVLDGGTLWVGAGIDRVAVVSTGRIEEDGGGPIHNLIVSRDAMLTIGPDRPTIERIVGTSADPRPTLGLQILTRPGSVSGDPVPVDHIMDVTIAAKFGPVELARVSTVTGAEILGGVHLNLREHGTVAQTTFVPTQGTQGDIRPVLTAAAGSFLLDVSGTLNIGEAPGIHIAAGKSGLAIDLDQSAGSNPEPWEGAMMTNIVLPTGLLGRRVLDRLDSAYQFTPAIATLPGRDQTLIARVLRRRRTTYSDDDPGMQRQLYEDAEFMRELAALCRKKGTPGSVATTVAWCAYRLRNLKARGVERMALGVYRTLGYGERPLPAFFLWAALALCLAGPVLAAGGAHFELSGYDNFLTEAGRLALGPLAGLLRGGTLSGGDLAEIAARALTSIPLVTGSLALRNYVKSER